MPGRVLTGFADVNGARLYHEVAGEGHSLVLVHAAIADLRMWDGQFGAFAERHRTVRWDMRGFGRSPMVEMPFSTREDLFGLMTFLGIEPAYLVGCSKGGETVIDFALEHPRMVDALVLVGSGVGGFSPEGPEGPEPPQWPELVAAYRGGDLARAAELEAEIEVVGRGRSPDQVDPSVLALVREMDEIALATEPRRNELEQALDPPAVGKLSEIVVPTLIVVGEADAPDIARAAEFLAREIADARMVTMPNTAHLPNMERPDDFNRLVLDFLASLPADPGERG